MRVGGASAPPNMFNHRLWLQPSWATGKREIHVHDLPSTILHLMGLDHEKLTDRYSGRDCRLTEVSGSVARGIIA